MLIRLNCLRIWREFIYSRWNWILYSNSICIRVIKFHKKRFCLKPLLISILIELSFPGKQSRRVGIAQICTRRMRYNQISPSSDIMPRPIRGIKLAPTVQNRQAVSHDVPFGMTSGTFLYIAGIRLDPTFSECGAYSLRFLTCDKHFRITHLPLPNVSAVRHIASRLIYIPSLPMICAISSRSLRLIASQWQSHATRTAVPTDTAAPNTAEPRTSHAPQIAGSDQPKKISGHPQLIAPPDTSRAAAAVTAIFSFVVISSMVNLISCPDTSAVPPHRRSCRYQTSRFSLLLLRFLPFAH